MRNNFSENYPHFRHAVPKTFANPVVGRKNFKNIGLKGRENINLPGAPACLGQALSFVDLAPTFSYTLCTTNRDLFPCSSVECSVLQTCYVCVVLGTMH